MLKVRIIPTLLYKEFGLVKGVGFNSWRRVGGVIQMVNIYNLRQVDELVFVDILATKQGLKPDFEIIKEIAHACFVPLTIGGGITALEDIQGLLNVGADKVIINTKAVQDPEFINKAAQKFGSQCIVVSIDFKKEDDRYVVYTHSGKNKTNIDPVSFAKIAEHMGAGEILLTSVDRDGTYKGYDIDLMKAVAKEVSIPIIASGGAGNYQDMFLAIQEGGASAVAAASMFHYTQQTPLQAKQYLKEKGVSVRL